MSSKFDAREYIIEHMLETVLRNMDHKEEWQSQQAVIAELIKRFADTEFEGELIRIAYQVGQGIAINPFDSEG